MTDSRRSRRQKCGAIFDTRWRGSGGPPRSRFAAVAALGLAIGANATIFGLVDGLWLRPPQVRDAARLEWVFSTTPDDAEGSWSYPEYEALVAGTSTFDGLVARGRRGATVASADGTPELALVNVVSPNFFTALGIAPALGRLFGPDDGASLDAQPVIVLGNAYWRRRFGGDPGVVGRAVTLSGRVSAIVAGVLPDTFRDLSAAADRDIWMPPADLDAHREPAHIRDAHRPVVRGAGRASRA